MYLYHGNRYYRYLLIFPRRYVSLSDNEKTGFKARELKSVQVDAVGVFLKLNIHKNHINKYNLYNQVGLVAINVIGDKIRKSLDERDDLVRMATCTSHHTIMNIA